MDEQLTAQQEYEYVESRWSDYRAMTYGRLDICDMEGEMDYHAAYLFTKERERQIAEVEEEIALVANVETTTAAFIASIYVAKHIKQDAAKEHPVWQRILAVEQSRLAELKRGMKEKP